MLDRENSRIFKELLAKLNQLPDFVTACVFGSRARGEYSSDSDMDVYVETKRSEEKVKNAIRHVAWEVGLENGVVISTLILSTDERYNSPLRSSAIVESIEHDGVTA